MDFQQFKMALSLVTTIMLCSVLHNNAAFSEIHFVKDYDDQIPQIEPYLQTTVTSLINCAYQCANVNNCTSFNFKENNSNHRACALLTETRQNYFVSSPGWSHYSILEKKSFNHTKVAFDCLDLYSMGFKMDGVYYIHPNGSSKIKAFCDMGNGGWTVVQRHHEDINLNFKRTWNEYKEGFGDLNKDFWWGNDNIHLLTNKSKNQFSFTYRTSGEKSFKQMLYNDFRVGSEEEDYVLRVKEFLSGERDPFGFHDGMPFATMDRDSASSCSSRYGQSGWWFNKCFRVNTNGYFYEFVRDEGVYLYDQLLTAVSLNVRRISSVGDKMIEDLSPDN